MKILSSEQIREADAYTIKNEPISSIDLMERASEAFTVWFVQHFDKSKPVNVICGPGNNGGDGLAVSRMLIQKGFEMKVYIVHKKDKGSDDFETNLSRLTQLQKVEKLHNVDDLPEISSDDLVVDAIFGSGLSRPAEGFFAGIIKVINESKSTVVAIDIASGLFSDKHVQGKNVVEADYTISFQLPKLAFFMPENEMYVGEWHVVDIGLSKKFINEATTSYYSLEIKQIVGKLLKRRKYAHKGNFGKALLITGSLGKMGAAVLCSKACLRTGAGLVTIHAPGCGYEILQSQVPEAMVLLDDSDEYFSSIPDTGKFDVIGVGPGIGTEEETMEAYEELLRETEIPIVIDADGLNMLGKNKSLLKYVPENSILTPHPKEFERIAGKFRNDYERLEMQQDFSRAHKLYIVLKGAHTSVSTPDGRVFFNSTGNPGMATGGSGDVLTGMLTALLGQQYVPLDAALLGVYLHGLAGDEAAMGIGQEALIASDIIDHIPAAYKKLHGLTY